MPLEIEEGGWEEAGGTWAKASAGHRTLHTAHIQIWLCLGDSLSLVLPICHLGTMQLPFRISDHTERPPVPGTEEAGDDWP